MEGGGYCSTSSRRSRASKGLGFGGKERGGRGELNSFWCLPIAETHRGDRKRSWKFRRWLCFKSSSGTAPLLVGRLVAVHAGGDAGEQGPSRRGRSCRDPGGT